MKKQYFGKQTEMALKNFPFHKNTLPLEFIYALAEIKKAAAFANKITGAIESDIADSISLAADDILHGHFDDQFPLPGLQGGAGTSINMNLNEVIANRATELLKEKGIQKEVHPNDHVNKSQSTNDVNPSALKLASIRLFSKLSISIDQLIQSFETKAIEYRDIQKLARTHLQDAVPTTFGEEFSSYVATIKKDKKRIEAVLPYFHSLNLGGTAIGNSINAPLEYRNALYEELSRITSLPLRPDDNLMSGTSSQTDFCMLSQAILLLCLDCSKIASDIRFLTSGPRGGIGEISLIELQPGSSIMPGKINPVLPESVNQLYYFVSGNNLTIEHASHGAQLELGVMFPILADRLLLSIQLTTDVLEQFAKQCIHHMTVNVERAKEHLEKSMAYATLLTPHLGYDTVSKAVKEAIKMQKTLRQVMIDNNLLSEDEFNQLIRH